MAESPGADQVPRDLTWRLAVRYRLALIALQALLPAIVSSFFWIPVSGDPVPPAPVTGFPPPPRAVRWRSAAGQAG